MKPPGGNPSDSTPCPREWSEISVFDQAFTPAAGDHLTVIKRHENERSFSNICASHQS
jgi:hypothetical protein